MASTPSRRFHGIGRRLRTGLLRHRKVVAAVVITLLFVLVLVIYAGPTIDGKNPQAGNDPSTPGSQSLSAAPGDIGTPSPTPSGTAGTLPAVPGLAQIPGINSTQLATIGPGRHRVVVTARSSEPILGIGYAFQGDKTARRVYNVKSPVVLVRTLDGQRPFATIVLQVGPTATSGSCSISVDGKVIDSRSTDRPYGTTGCSA